jgi:hypothetical protein
MTDRGAHILFMALVCACTPARAEDKSRYTLLDPTPRGLMRELDTDRPDITESPITVDAGHFQAEFSFVDFTHDRTDGVTTDALTALPSNLKVGLLNNVDLQFVITPYLNERTRGRGASSRRDGLGDTEVRFKVNLLGNDGGQVAFGVMPYVKFPTATHGLGNDHYEGGLILPVKVQLPGEFELGAMLEIDVIRDAGDGYGTALLHTVGLEHKIVGELSGYVEYAGTSFVGAGATYQAVAATGLVYALGDDAEIDVGVNVGLSDSAQDVEVFAGMTFRI